MSYITRIGGTNRYSDIVIHNNVAYLSGIVPYDISNNIIGQTQEVLNTLDKLLNSINSSKDHILSMTIYLKDASLYEEMNYAFDRWVSSPPARATIGIVSFPNPRWLIELVVTAAVVPNYYCDCSNNIIDLSNCSLSNSNNFRDCSNSIINLSNCNYCGNCSNNYIPSCNSYSFPRSSSNTNYVSTSSQITGFGINNVNYII